MKYVVDTSSLMHHLSKIPFAESIVPTLVLRELDKHKNSSDPERAFLAQVAIKAIREHHKEIEFDFNQYPRFVYLSEKEYDIDYHDNRLLESLFHHRKAGRNVGLITSDFGLEVQARAFGFPVLNPSENEKEPYQGTITIPADDHRISYFFKMLSNPVHENVFDCLVGEYILIMKEPDIRRTNSDDEEEVAGAWKWTGTHYKRISMNQVFSSSNFPEVKPKNFRQAAAMDSLKSNPLTILTGKAGTGKTYLATAYILQQIEHFDRPVYLITNNVPMRGSRTFGLKKGKILEKILQSNLGNILKSKIGLKHTESLITNQKIQLVPLEDIRGTSFNGIVYITEAQNYTIDMVKVLLERMEEEGQIIFDGDQRQIDLSYAQGSNNGIQRMLDIYKGSGYMGHVELRGNQRSVLSKLAEKM
ncbi:PhoH family protein [Caldibacillus debilis]|uniref:Putative ATPase n=1 Tax=Caldibacillus debilis GB1 TaxID=1339248 RepID=A0A420VDS6_9BACI|nr:PhoH family protein [Caldibacillus debilis]RKO61706.1 putative ATPase [Caldibacillus debilis GB1]